MSVGSCEVWHERCRYSTGTYREKSVVIGAKRSADLSHFWSNYQSVDEVRVQERKQKLLSRNLESVFCLSISKSQGEVRKLDSAWRYLDLEICPGSKIRGEARNLDSGWPAPVIGNW